MPYFKELPNFQYIANFPNQSFNTDYVVSKNIFKRAKLRTDISNSLTAFNYYQIIDNERPDQVAAKVYDNAELDWVILITNNITNINQQWPLDNNSFYKYLIDKYGSDEELGKTHHWETVEFKDEYGRIVVPGGYQVDPAKTLSVTTTEGQNNYILSEFPNENTNYSITINLNQYLPVYNGKKETTQAIIKDIGYNSSTLKIAGRQNKIDIGITNILDTWPTSWGGNTTIKGRTENTKIQVLDIVFENDVVLNPLLYEIVGEEVNGEIVPVFNFKPQI
jgi:Base plate wedge protein 53